MFIFSVLKLLAPPLNSQSPPSSCLYELPSSQTVLNKNKCHGMFSSGNYYHPKTHIHSNLIITSLKSQIHVLKKNQHKTNSQRYLLLKVSMSFLILISCLQTIPKRALVIIMSRFSLRLHMILCDIFEMTHRDNFRFKVDFNVLPPSQLCCKYHFFPIINTLYSKAVLAEFRQFPLQH